MGDHFILARYYIIEEDDLFYPRSQHQSPIPYISQPLLESLTYPTYLSIISYPYSNGEINSRTYKYDINITILISHTHLTITTLYELFISQLIN